MFKWDNAPYFIIKPKSNEEAQEWRESVESVIDEYFDALDKGAPHSGRLRNGMTLGNMACYLQITDHGKSLLEKKIPNHAND